MVFIGKNSVMSKRRKYKGFCVFFYMDGMVLFENRERMRQNVVKKGYFKGSKAFDMLKYSGTIDLNDFGGNFGKAKFAKVFSLLDTLEGQDRYFLIPFHLFFLIMLLGG